MMKKNRIMILTIVVIILGIYTCIIGINSRGVQNPIEGDELALSATDMDGNQVDNSILKGEEFTIVYIWSATDEKCTNGLDDILAIADEYGDELNVVGLITDIESDDAKKLISKKKIAFQNYLINDKSYNFIFSHFYEIPLILFVNNNGVVLEQFIEGMANYNDLKYIINKLIVK